MSASGYKQTCGEVRQRVCFTPVSGHWCGEISSASPTERPIGCSVVRGRHRPSTRHHSNSSHVSSNWPWSTRGASFPGCCGASSSSGGSGASDCSSLSAGAPPASAGVSSSAGGGAVFFGLVQNRLRFLQRRRRSTKRPPMPRSSRPRYNERPETGLMGTQGG